jgi:hypothetical protein
LARQAAWYPEVYDRPELYLCAKCHQPDETQEHIYECTDHSKSALRPSSDCSSQQRPRRWTQDYSGCGIR